MKTWAEIKSLHANQIPESEILDYKRDCYGNSDKDRREILKDVSSFANTRGGHIVIGVDEDQGVPTAVSGIDVGIDLDAEIQRMGQVINSGFDPAFTNVQIRQVLSDDGDRCLVIEIAKSPIAPHRIASGNYHKFFVRDSNGKHEATMPELRDMFTFGEMAKNRFRDFCRQRIEIINDPERDTTGILTENGLLVVHIAPLATITSDSQIDLRTLHDSQYQSLQAMGTMGISRRFNFDGLIVYSGGDPLISYVQVFRNGIIEAACGDICFEEKKHGLAIAGGLLEKNFFVAFPGYIQVFDEINVPPPFVVQITLDGVRGAFYAHHRYGMAPMRQARLDRNRMFLSECVIESNESIADIHRAIKPAFDSLYNALGEAECSHFNEEGLWQI